MDANFGPDLEKRMRRLGVSEADLVEKFILGAGSGGQKLQKTSSAVYLRHIPTKEVIKCQKTRSREQNRYYARVELCDRLERKKRELQREKQKKRHLEAQKRRGRSKKTKEQMLEEKRRRSKKKGLRRKPSIDD